jgi:hypothetical protein
MIEKATSNANIAAMLQTLKAHQSQAAGVASMHPLTQPRRKPISPNWFARRSDRPTRHRLTRNTQRTLLNVVKAFP